MTEERDGTTRSLVVAIVGFLVSVELASGVLQGYYTPDLQGHRRTTSTSATPA